MLIFFMLMGGGTGSTAGAIKPCRIYILFRAFGWELRRRRLPRTAVTTQAVWVGEQRRFVDDAQIRDAAVSVFLYLAAFGLGAAIIAAYGYSFRDNAF